MTVAVIGPMGAGKSSIGKRLAKLVNARFADTDALIVAEHGAIADLFTGVGEQGFRAIEARIVARALHAGGVVALGGGAVLDERTRLALADCTVVLLTVSESAVAARITGAKRPLLVDGVASWRAIAAERAPIYARLADITVDTSRRPITTIAAELARRPEVVAAVGAGVHA